MSLLDHATSTQHSARQCQYHWVALSYMVSDTLGLPELTRFGLINGIHSWCSATRRVLRCTHCLGGACARRSPPRDHAYPDALPYQRVQQRATRPHVRPRSTLRFDFPRTRKVYIADMGTLHRRTSTPDGRRLWPARCLSSKLSSLASYPASLPPKPPQESMPLRGTTPGRLSVNPARWFRLGSPVHPL